MQQAETALNPGCRAQTLSRCFLPTKGRGLRHRGRRRDKRVLGPHPPPLCNPPSPGLALCWGRRKTLRGSGSMAASLGWGWPPVGPVRGPRVVSTRSQPGPCLGWQSALPGDTRPRPSQGSQGWVLRSFLKPFPGLERGECQLSAWLKCETQTSWSPVVEPPRVSAPARQGIWSEMGPGTSP